MIFNYGGHTDIGFGRELNEDFISIKELDDDTLLAIIADGAGSKPSLLQPAQIVTNAMNEEIKNLYDSKKELVLDNASLVLSNSMLNANKILGAFKIANEELYSGYGVSATAVLFYKKSINNKNVYLFSFAHTGNTRLYLLRTDNKNELNIAQLTSDFTKAKTLLDDGILTKDQYHTNPDRLVITQALGLVDTPLIQTSYGIIKDGDFYLLTTDGIHYAIRQEGMVQIVSISTDLSEGSKNMCEASKSFEYPDNASACIVYKPFEQ